MDCEQHLRKILPFVFRPADSEDQRDGDIETKTDLVPETTPQRLAIKRREIFVMQSQKIGIKTGIAIASLIGAGLAVRQILEIEANQASFNDTTNMAFLFGLSYVLLPLAGEYIGEVIGKKIGPRILRSF